MEIIIFPYFVEIVFSNKLVNFTIPLKSRKNSQVLLSRQCVKEIKNFIQNNVL